MSTAIVLLRLRSVVRARVGPAVKQSDGTAGGFRSPPDERLPDRAARGQPVHAGKSYYSQRRLHVDFPHFNISIL